MTIPRVYRKTSERPNITFPFSDIADGTGIVNFLGCNSIATGADITYFLTTSTMDSGKTATRDTNTFTNTFDLTFNTSKRIKGDARVNITIGANSTGTDKVINGTVTLQHYDGSSATNMATAETTANFTALQGTGAKSKRYNLTFPITTLFKFKRGEILRVVVTITSVSGGGSFGFAHDPADKNETDDTTLIIEDTDSTQLNIHIPFLI